MLRLLQKLFFAAFCALAVSAYAAENSPELVAKIAKANGECLACHSEAGVKSPPRAGLDLVKLRKFQLDSLHFDKSNHAGMACTQCHSNAVASYPHDADTRAKISPCEECHAAKVMRVEKQIKDSVHGGTLKEPLTCTSCHNPHRGAVATRLKDARQIAAQDNKICLDCHQSDLAMAKVSGDNKPRKDIDAIHDWLPNTRLHWGAVRCLECHTASDKKPHEIVNGDKAERQCVTCHSANSTLKTRLYRHQALVEQEKLGFLNSAVLSSAYVVGATRHPMLDRAIIALVALTLFGVLGHGAARIIVALWRRRKQRKNTEETRHD